MNNTKHFHSQTRPLAPSLFFLRDSLSAALDAIVPWAVAAAAAAAAAAAEA